MAKKSRVARKKQAAANRKTVTAAQNVKKAPAVEAVALQIVVEPSRDVAAPALHEVYLLLSDGDILESGNLPGKLVGESGRVDGVVAVCERIFYPGSGKIVYHRTAHRELIEVIVSEMVYYLSHRTFDIKAACRQARRADCARPAPY